ncbi:GL15049 [Drosophila persimilis]|uniref:SURF1-like protein n=1 Tax=Drosophila persimilis TaxID=7234 RepID=B4HAY4_DROPE|nr:GL15049 [Drosophila persimilis]
MTQQRSPVDFTTSIRKDPKEKDKITALGWFLLLIPATTFGLGCWQEMRMGPRSLIRPDGGETQGGLFSQRDAGNGYLIVTPFQLSDRDDIVLINRGWVSRKHVDPESRALAQDQSEVELTAVVRQGESRPQFTPDHKGVNMYLYRDLPRMCAATGAAPVFLDAIYDPQGIRNGPIGGQTRITLRNDHMSYLVTWFSLSAATSFLWYRQIVKRLPF